MAAVPTVADLVAGERVAGFVVLTDRDGLRHAVRAGAVLALSDAGDAGGETVMQLTGSRAVVVRRPMHEVLDWFR